MRVQYAFIRLLLFIVVLPFAIAVLVPLWIARRYDVAFTAPSDLLGVLLQAVGALLLLLGLALFASSFYQIVTRERGPLAPWDPPSRLVVRGAYRFVRNPMISGVTLILFGEALVLQSVPHGIWAVAFLLLTIIYVSFLDEPQLEARFGDEYRRYRRHVSRFLPRLRPWNPDAK